MNTKKTIDLAAMSASILAAGLPAQRPLSEAKRFEPTMPNEHACAVCGAEVDNWDYTLCQKCFDTGARAGSVRDPIT